MRLLSLDLERYGPFSGTSLAFKPEARLHIVYGPNEAGKSSALAAIADLFFGFEHRTSSDFLHKSADLRVGAHIVSRSGQELAFRRRKGTKGTLLGMDGAALRDDALQPFLRGLSREVFLKSFGLNSAKLREGARELLEDDAETGTGFFAAASGLHGLRRLIGQMDAEADAIFAARDAAHRAFYRALERHAKARNAIAESELRVPAWTLLNEEIAQLKAEAEESGRQRQHLGTERARLERLGRVKTVMALIDGDLSRLRDFVALPAHDVSSAPRLAEAIAELEKATAAVARERDRETAIERQLADIAVDEAVLVHEDAVDAVVQQLSAYKKFAEDLPRVEMEAAGFRTELRTLAVRLGLSNAALLETRQPQDSAKAEVAKLLTEGRSLASETALQDREIGLELAELEGQADGADSTVSDPTALRQTFDALRPALNALGGRDRLAAQIDADMERLTQRAARLKPSISNLDRLAISPLPAADRLARFRESMEELRQDMRKAEEAKERAQKDLAAAEATLTKIGRGGVPPSAEDIAKARGQRDRLWSEIKDHILGAAPRPIGEVAHLAEGLAAATALADRLADEGIRDAARVAEYGNAQSEQVKGREAIESAVRTAAHHAAALEAAQRAWHEEWSPAGIAPLSPADMQTWLAAAGALLEEREDLSARRAELARIAARAEETSAALRSLADTAGLPQALHADPEIAAGQIAAQLKAMEKTWSAHREAAVKRAALVESIGRKQARGAKAEELRREWRDAWRAAMTDLGLPAEASMEQAEAVLAAWRAVPDVLKERDNREQRVRGMRRDMDALEARTSAIVAALDPTLARLAPSEVIGLLGKRLDQARKSAIQRAAAQSQNKEASQVRARAESAHQRCQGDLAALMAAYKDTGEPEDLLRRLKERAEALDTLTRHREELARAGAGFTEEALRHELESFDPDSAAASLAGLTATESEILEREKQYHALLHQKIAKRDELSAGTGAEFAAFERRGAEAELAGLARDWLVLKTGQSLIEEAVKRHRAGREGSLLGRAAQLFTQLTGGAFNSLEQAFDDDDKPRLMSRRSTGGALPVSGLSEGTRDQLYLALRLAFLEDYAGRAEPSPFIADDILTTFDDPRTGRGLEVLAATGGALQPILFTHHDHVVGTARGLLGDAVDIIQL